MFDSDVEFFGNGNCHNTNFNHLATHSFVNETYAEAKEFQSLTSDDMSQDGCRFSIHIYPTAAMEDTYTSRDPVNFTVVVVSIFLFAAIFFLIYDWLVERQQKKVFQTAKQSSAIVSSLFPSVVRNRLFPTHSRTSAKDAASGSTQGFHSQKLRLNSYLINSHGTAKGNGEKDSQPIAEF